MHGHTPPVVLFSAVLTELRWKPKQLDARMKSPAEKWLFWHSPGRVATVCGWGGQTYNLLMSSSFSAPKKRLKSVHFWRSYSEIKMWSFFSGTQCILNSISVIYESDEYFQWLQFTLCNLSKIHLNIEKFSVTKFEFSDLLWSLSIRKPYSEESHTTAGYVHRTCYFLNFVASLHGLKKISSST